MTEAITGPTTLSSSLSSKVPPQNLEAEQSVLGSILLKAKSFHDVMEIIEPNDFYKNSHRIIFEAMIRLFEKNEPLDLLTVTNYLNDRNQLEDAGSAAYLATLTSIVPVTANIHSYANIIRQKSILRRLIQINTELAVRCYDEQDDIDTLVDEAEQAIFDITGSKSRQGFTPLHRIIPEAFETVETLYKRKELVTGVPTGYSGIDKLTAGLQPSDLIILAGRPSMGKTALP